MSQQREENLQIVRIIKPKNQIKLNMLKRPTSQEITPKDIFINAGQSPPYKLGF